MPREARGFIMRSKLTERASLITIPSAIQSIDGRHPSSDLFRLNVNFIAAASLTIIRSVGFKPPSPC